MRAQQIIRMGAPVLRRRADEILDPASKQIAALAADMADAMVAACPMYSASVRRGTDIINNRLPHIGPNAPAGPGFDAAARGSYASVDDFLQEADDALRSERFRMYIKIIMVSLRVEESAPEAAKLSWAALLDNDTVAALDDCAQLDDFRVAIQTFWHDKRRALRASAAIGSGADPEQQRLLLLSVSGVAAGLQNTG